MFHGEAGKVVQTENKFKNVLEESGNQFDLANRLRNQGVNIPEPKTNNYKVIDDALAKYAKKNGYDAIKYSNVNRAGANPFVEYHDVNSGQFYSTDKGIAVVNSNRGAGKVGGEVKLPTTPKKQIMPQVTETIKPSSINLIQEPSSFEPNIAKERGFVKTIREEPITAPQVAVKVQGKYTPITNVETLTDAQKAVQVNYDIAKQRVLTEPLTAETNAIGQEIMRQSQNAGRFDEAIEMAETMAKKGTESGQAVQAFSIWSKMTPEGMLRYATKTIDNANKSLGAVSKAVRK